MSFNKKIEELIREIRAEHTDLRGQVARMRTQISELQKQEEPPKEDERVVALQKRNRELEAMLQAVQVDRDRLNESLERLRSISRNVKDAIAVPNNEEVAGS